MLLELFYTILSTVLSSSVIIFLKNVADRKENKAENEEIDKKIKSVDEDIGIGEGEDINIIKLMYNNLKELREYYVISKRQANKAFSASLLVCIFGVIIYVLGIVLTCVLDKDITLISIISGTTVELIAGLFFWMYNKSNKQLNIYHKRLSETEKYLISIQLTEKMTDDQKYQEIHYIIQSIMK